MYKAIQVLQGRLGNILFEVANGLTYAKRTGKELHFNVRSTSSTPIHKYSDFTKNIKIEKIEDVLHNEPRRVVYENQGIAPKEIINEKEHIIINGYYQSEFYMDPELVRNYFKIDNDLKQHLLQKYPGIENGVGLSVRRGDYLKHTDIFHCLNHKYYEDTYHKYFEGGKCFVSSDDITWCQVNLAIPNITFIEEEDEVCLRCLSLCKNHILSCSTFSWWAAWLEEKIDSVNVVPSPWFNPEKGLWNESIIPDRWIKNPIQKDYLSYSHV